MEEGNDEEGATHYNNSKDLSPSSSLRRVMQRATENRGLSLDMLGIIFKKLEFDDLFQFGGVCTTWRKFSKSYWGDFMASQAPLVIQTSSYAKKACSFISISEEKIHNTELDYFWGLSYAGFSNGYVIMVGTDNTLLLMNPFTRTKKKINASPLQDRLIDTYNRVLLVFAKGSKEFVIMALSTRSYNFHIYQSRNSCWEIYSRWGDPWKVVDIVVLNHTLYAITNRANIGVLSLNSPCLKFLQFNNTPTFSSSNLKLVSINGQLLVVHFRPTKELHVYKIDFSSMDWVRMETLGDLALFVGSFTKCYALSNPGRWGYDSNSIYYIDRQSPTCKVYSMNNELVKSLSLEQNYPPPKSKLYWLDWCFRHLYDEVDYSLVE